MSLRDNGPAHWERLAATSLARAESLHGDPIAPIIGRLALCYEQLAMLVTVAAENERPWRHHRDLP